MAAVLILGIFGIEIYPREGTETGEPLSLLSWMWLKFILVRGLLILNDKFNQKSYTKACAYVKLWIVMNGAQTHKNISNL